MSSNDTDTNDLTPGRRGVRLEDLARVAGVSIATISRALNDSPAVNEETKRKIWRLAREQGYSFRPHMPAMLSKASRTVTVVLPTPTGREGKISDPFYMELFAAIAEAGRDVSANVLIAPDTPQNFDELYDFVAANRSDGIIFLGQGALHERFNRLYETERRFVVWGGQLPGQKYCSVGSDNVSGGRRATSHLIRLGRRKLAFLGNVEAPEAAQRHEGYQQALSEAGLPYEFERVRSANYEFEAATIAVRELLEHSPDCDAIFAASDLIAIGAIRALKQTGRRVPEDVSVVGYDDLLIARYHAPMLTTVSQDLMRAGRMMVSKLLYTNENSTMISERVGTDLVVRESCGA